VASEIYLDGWTFGSRRYPVDRFGAKMDPTDPNALLSIWKRCARRTMPVMETNAAVALRQKITDAPNSANKFLY
jgi:hypothetical protein